MIPTGPVPVRSLPVRKGPRGVRQVEVSPGRWMDEAVAIAQGIPLTYPLPTNGAGPVIVRREAPEVPPMPATAIPSKPPARGTGAPPSPEQEQAWKAVTERGLYWPDVARELGTTSWAVKNMIASYMRRNGIPGEPPGRTPKEETTRRTMLAKGQTPKPSTPPQANGSESRADAFAGPPSEPLVLVPEGHPWATDPEPVDLHRPIAPPPPDERTDWSGAAQRHVERSVVDLRSDHSETIPAADPCDVCHQPVASMERWTNGVRSGHRACVESTTQTIVAAPINGGLPFGYDWSARPDPAPPPTGGGGRDVSGDDFLGRLERELDALAREDAELVARARELVEARTAVATRIERLRTAGEVYRAVMAGRAA